jgi:hypothetical protein
VKFLSQSVGKSGILPKMENRNTITLAFLAKNKIVAEIDNFFDVSLLFSVISPCDKASDLKKLKTRWWDYQSKLYMELRNEFQVDLEQLRKEKKRPKQFIHILAVVPFLAILGKSNLLEDLVSESDSPADRQSSLEQEGAAMILAQSQNNAIGIETEFEKKLILAVFLSGNCFA